MVDATDRLLEYRRRLLAYLLHLVGDPHEAADLLQELSVAVLENPGMLTRAGDVFAYLRGVARHLAAGRRKVRVRTTEALRRWTEWAWEADPGDPETEADRRGQIRALRLCRKELRGRAGRVISLRYEAGLELKTIAERIGARVGTVKVALLRARRALGRCIRRRLKEKAAL